ncbi:hypothetical protein BOW93_gp037 [Salmonella phage 118970_sal3]|uniref:hypothetical protein n=1 Tax=Salmonella phage 118970_sal3 TaxID=1813771 RepID=UPI0008658BE1|nr:hypothetical protein BOW93_gp037 [Salmonella phage 118970_sal3]AOP04176.1 hypothetical protein 118970sal3_00037 [Salmonella phage 118970_sal3]
MVKRYCSSSWSLKKINSENLISQLKHEQKEQQWLEDKEPLSTALKNTGYKS